MKKTLIKKDDSIFKISTNDIKAEFETDSRSVLNKAMEFFGLTYKDSEHVNFYVDQYHNNAFEIFMTKDECLAFAELYGHERKRIIKRLVAKLEVKYKHSNIDTSNDDEAKKDALKSIKSIQIKMQCLSIELKKQLEILNL